MSPILNSGYTPEDSANDFFLHETRSDANAAAREIKMENAKNERELAREDLINLQADVVAQNKLLDQYIDSSVVFRSIIDYLNEKISTLDPKTSKEKIHNETAIESQKIAKRISGGNLTAKEKALKEQFKNTTSAKRKTLKYEAKLKMGSRIPGAPAPPNKPKKTGP